MAKSNTVTCRLQRCIDLLVKYLLVPSVSIRLSKTLSFRPELFGQSLRIRRLPSSKNLLVSDLLVFRRLQISFTPLQRLTWQDHQAARHYGPRIGTPDHGLVEIRKPKSPSRHVHIRHELTDCICWSSSGYIFFTFHLNVRAGMRYIDLLVKYMLVPSVSLRLSRTHSTEIASFALK